MADVNPFEAREHSFYIAGEMTAFDVAAVQDYLGKLGLRVIERPLPPAVGTFEGMDLPEAARDEVITKAEFAANWGSGAGHVWSRVVRGAQEGKFPLELRLIDGDQVGFTHQSAEKMLALMASEGYDGPKLTPSASNIINRIVSQRRRDEEQAASILEG